MKKKTFTIAGMHCTSCALVIESDLEDLGVKASVHYAKQTLDVAYDEARVSEKQIIDAVAKAGYQIV